MTPRILDEHSLLEREQSIIDAALVIIQREGVENLTIDKVVALVPFSKGTVYKHFLGKEDVLLAITNQAISILSDFFSRAANYDGCPRERMLLSSASYLIYAILHPVFFMADLCSRSPSVLEKCNTFRIETQTNYQTTLMSSITSIIEDGIDKKNLALPHFMNIQQVCFSNWSLSYGIISLLSEDIDSCEGRTGLNIDRELFNNCNVMLDGLYWLPLTKDKDYKTALMHALNTVFPEELQRIQKLGRELNF
jgi:AcrR family transcriptional regulator